MEIDRLDHLVMTVQDVEATCQFYARVLGMQIVTFGDNRRALHFGSQKINVHPATPEPALLVARQPTPGSADLCFITRTPLADVIAHLTACGVAIEAGSVPRTGALGSITSVYFRDLDGNLIEVSNYAE